MLVTMKVLNSYSDCNDSEKCSAIFLEKSLFFGMFFKYKKNQEKRKCEAVFSEDFSFYFHISNFALE